MVRQGRSIYFWANVAAVAALCSCCAIAKSQGNGTRQPSASTASNAMTESGIAPKAMRIYRRAVEELHEGQAVRAEKDALRAVRADRNFADADALAATAALKQRQFERGREEAESAVGIDARDEKAWVVLATADNYLARYADAAEALGRVQPQDCGTWQVAYQWARAEAGQGHSAQALGWANRAAQTAPPRFAPLHLLRASALSSAGQYAQAADELDAYLRLTAPGSLEHDELTRELHRLRELVACRDENVSARGSGNMCGQADTADSLRE